jgi:DNA-binding transcriptional LysR family regulator
MDFDWNDLPFFLAIARHGNLNRAAAALEVNHSTVFRRVNGMEERLGARLFERLPEGYSLTPAGEQILAHAQHAEDAVHALRRSVAGRDAMLTGQIRMTAAPDLARHFVAPGLVEFARRQPGIRVELAVGDSDYDLGRREADLALRATPRPPEHLVGRHVAGLTWRAYASEDYLGARGRPASSADLGEHALIGSDEGLARVAVFADLRRRFPPQQFAATSNDLGCMAALAAAGLGIAFLPFTPARYDLVPLFDVTPPHRSELWILTHPDLRGTARIRLLADFLFEWLRRDPRLAVAPDAGA